MSRNREEAFHFSRLRNGWEVGRFSALNELESVVHMVTTRNGPALVGAATDCSATAKLVAEVMNLHQIAWCEQVHGCNILPAKAGGFVGRGDGMVTNIVSLGLMVRGADCPLILAVDPDGEAVGVAHASWRGTVGRIASKLISTLVGRFRVEAANVIACICPSAGPCCYEVGSEVRDAAIQGIGQRAEQFFLNRDGKLHFDLWAANRDELTQAGLRLENIHQAGLCTICNNDRFPSYRAEGSSTGRFVAVVGFG